ncbi:MAG: hypothetical protein MRZ79_03190 [Bacteroidia bacterium]|nr:hypothetical protein [Bacteroidia bacterium]
MKSINYLQKLILLLLTGFVLFSCETQQGKVIKTGTVEPVPYKKPSKRDRMDLAWKHDFEMTKDPATGLVPIEELRIARENLKREILSNQNQSRAGITGISWDERGPNNVPGRTRAFLFDESDATNNTVFVGSVAGGLWKTTNFQNANPTWTHQNEFWNNLAVSAIAQDPSNTNIIYVATGEGWGNTDAVQGEGIWKTTNGGTSFTQLANSTGIFFVNDLEVAANGDLYVATRFFGLWKSTDGGVNYTTVLSTGVNGLDLSGTSTPSANSRMGDLEIGADGDLYVSSYGEVWKSDAATYGGNTGDAGNWVRIFPPASGTGSTSTIDRLEMAVAPSDADRLYILGEGVGSNDVTEMYRSENVSGNPLTTAPTYTTLTIPTIIDQGSGSIFTRGQAWYDLIAQVDPNNANTLYIGGIDALRSSDRGATWTQITTWSLFGATGYTSAQNVHADHHNIIFEPGSSTNAVITSDGGIDYTTDINNTVSLPSFATKGTNYNTTQFYACAMHPDAGIDYFLAGAQDNGSQQFSSSGVNATVEVTGGDGAFCHIDQTNSTTQITSFIYNNYRISTNSFASFTNYNYSSTAGKFINPTDYDNTNNILYGAWNTGQYLRVEDVEGTPTASTFTFGTFGGNEVSAVTVSPNNPATVFLGLDNFGTGFDGDVYRIDNANTGAPSATRILQSSTLASASGYVSCIAVENGNDNHLLVTYSNYGVNSVWETTDGGIIWNNREGDLPNIPIRWAMFVPGQSNQALLATELGVWSTDDLSAAGGTDWDATNTNLANVRVDMLQTRVSDDVVIAATHGRGLYSTTAFSATTVNFSGGELNTVEDNTSGTKAAPDDCLDFIDYTVTVVINKNPTADANIEVSAAATSSATEGIDFDILPSTFTFTTAGVTTQDVTIRIYDDEAVESLEDIDMEIAVTNAGTTDAVAGSDFQKNVNIQDNDFTPDPSTNFALVGSGTGLSSFGTVFRSNTSDFKLQTVYTAAELTTAGFSAGDNFKAIAWNVTTKNSTQPFSDFTIKMKNTSTTEFPGSLEFETGTTTVYSGDVTTAAGWNQIIFDSQFAWDGTSNLLVETCFNNASAGANADVIQSTNFTGVLTNQNTWYESSTTTDGCDIISFASASFFRPDVRLYNSLETVVEDQIVSADEYLGPNETVYFYEASGNVICRIDNGPHDFGCTTVQIDRSTTSAGAAHVDFWNSAAGDGNDLVAKTLNITPTNNNATASYDMTVYFTQAELDDWASATGQTIGDIIVVKTDGITISTVTPAGGASNNSSIDSVTTITQGTFGTNYTLTASFTDGFSGFGFGVPGIAPSVTPVEFLGFEGEYVNEEVLLDWSTGSEKNNMGFSIERAIRGEEFEEIAFVDGIGNSSVIQKYQFVDKKLPFGNTTYTYRLKQVDLDGSFEYSDQVEVFVPTASIGVSVAYNSGLNESFLLFNQAPMKNGKIELFQLNGQRLATLFEEKLESVNYPLNRVSLASGIYLIKVSFEDGETIVRKWIHNN